MTYGYDAAGNRLQVAGSWARANLPPAVASATYDAANRLAQWGAATLTYDDNGNLTHDGTQSYTWNVRDQLASMTGASFQYDASGHRQRRIVDGTTTDWVYDGLTPVQEQDGTQVTVNQLTGLGIDEYLARLEGSSTRSLLPDALGSTVGLADEAGTVQTEYTYAPFGATTVSGQASANPHEFTGREADGTGVYYYRARYYSPGLSRFLSEDPILSPTFSAFPCSSTSPGGSLGVGLRMLQGASGIPGIGGLPLTGMGQGTWPLPLLLKTMPAEVPQVLSPYTYVANTPLNKRDPKGLMSEDACLGVCRVTYAAICSLACEPFLHVNPMGWLLCNISCFVVGEVVCHDNCRSKSGKH